MLFAIISILERVLPCPSSKSTLSQPLKETCMSKVVGIGSMIIFHLSRLRKATFSILCDVIFLVRLQGKFEIGHSWEWKVTVRTFLPLVDAVTQPAEKSNPGRPSNCLVYLQHIIIISYYSRWCFHIIHIIDNLVGYVSVHLSTTWIVGQNIHKMYMAIYNWYLTRDYPRGPVDCIAFGAPALNTKRCK